jgi:hypothetical protein
MLLNTDDANNLIVQMDKKNHFKAAQITRIDKLNEVNYMVDSLNKNRDFHLYGSIDINMKVFLNKLLSDLFDVEDDRPKAVETLDIIIEDINFIIKKLNHYNKPLTKKEWLIYLNMIKFSMSENINFFELYDRTDMELMNNDLKYIQEPSVVHYRKVYKNLKEVITDANV